ncbi:hypothetical protein KY321_01440 [Candidatus Woesearchaeota archaeon]|nr:hypothetical protein [Candidatus Woesearchaeota archaeon]
MIDINASIPVVTTVGTVVGDIVVAISYMIGGLFGLYLIMFLHRIFTFKKYDNKLEEIVDALDSMDKKLNRIERKLKEPNAKTKK